MEGAGRCLLTVTVFMEFKQRRFWATQVNQKWAFFSFNMPWRYQICIARCLDSYRDDLHKNLFKITAREFKRSTSGSRASLKNVAGLAPFNLSAHLQGCFLFLLCTKVRRFLMEQNSLFFFNNTLRQTLGGAPVHNSRRWKWTDC